MTNPDSLTRFTFSQWLLLLPERYGPGLPLGDDTLEAQLAGRLEEGFAFALDEVAGLDQLVWSQEVSE